MNKKDAQIVIRRVKKVSGHGHHGGAWKVAYADFVTAMMAFFLVMWLVGATTNKEKAAISEYFKNPSAFKGHSLEPASGPNGPGGASTSMIKLGGTSEIPRGKSMDPFQGASETKFAHPVKNGTQTKETIEAAADAEHIKLQSLYGDLKGAIQQSTALAPYKDQLLLDVSQLGLRVQIVDKQNRPMFDSGSAELKPYAAEILHEMAKHLNGVANKISITGHTDNTPYGGTDGYTNWELSADRANSARRALVAGGLDPARIALVVGLADQVPLDKANPADAVNRRISIVVMSSDTEKAELGDGMHVEADNAPAASKAGAKADNAGASAPGGSSAPAAAGAADASVPPAAPASP